MVMHDEESRYTLEKCQGNLVTRFKVVCMNDAPGENYKGQDRALNISILNFKLDRDGQHGVGIMRAKVLICYKEHVRTS